MIRRKKTRKAASELAEAKRICHPRRLCGLHWRGAHLLRSPQRAQLQHRP